MSHSATRYPTLLALAALAAACGDNSSGTDASGNDPTDDGAVSHPSSDGSDEASDAGDGPDDTDADQADLDAGQPDATEPCTSALCMPASCTDLTQDGEETGIDCGGSCAACPGVAPDAGFTPVRMSATDQSKGSSQADGSPVPNIVLSDDGRTIEVLGMDEGGARSDTAVAPQSAHTYYFEGERLFANTADFWGFGVASADAPLSSALGGTADSFGVFTQGSVTTDFYTCAGTAPMSYVNVPGASAEGGEHFGFVVDYRDVHPSVYLIANNLGGEPVVICSTTLSAITKPLFIMYEGRRATVGPQARINTGADTTNLPFFYTPAQIENALTLANAAAVIPTLVYGFTRTRALPADAAPLLTAPADVSVALGGSLTLTATANDAEDGVITNRIQWIDPSSSFSHAIRGSGGSFTFTPVGIGAHQIGVSVTDTVGHQTQQTVVVNVTGTLPSYATVRFVADANNGERALLTPDGLGVYFGPTGHFKDAVRVNQGLQGDFWYFEATRPPLVPPDTMVRGFGIGLIVGDAPLNPYSIYEVPWSMSINTASGVWKALVNVGNLSVGSATPGNEAAVSPTLDRYGFAVDYRGAHPRVHVLVGSGGSARFIKTVLLDDVNVPIYPMVYSGDSEDGTADRPAVTLNFGTPQFGNVRAALANPPDPDIALSSSDIAALKLGWHATP